LKNPVNTIATQTENLVNTIAIQTESNVNTVATQTKNFVNTIATQTEFNINIVSTQTENFSNTIVIQTKSTINTVVTQTEIIIIQSNEIQIEQTNKQILKIKNYTKEELKTAIKQQLIENKYQYTTKTIQIVTKVCQIGKMSYRSAVEYTKAHRDVAKFYSNQQSNIIENSKFSAYGIMANESKR
ncbi:7492_t:CDS:2, partial [Racocetra persica]